MSRKVPPLTATQIKSAKPKEKEYNLADGDGLFLRIKPSGSKRWIFNYSRPFTKKRANMGFGSYPMVSLAEARCKRLSAQELLAQSIDPKAHKDEQEQLKKDALESTFGAMADKWHQLKRQQVKLETAEKAFRSLEKHVLPYLKNVPLEAIKPKTVIKLLEPVKANGNLETVKRLCRSINEVMRLGVASGVIEVNYLTDVTKMFPPAKRKNMATLPPDRLSELMIKLNQANISRTTRCLIEWQLHTMTRPIEAATTEWKHIDLNNKVWIIPAERMKMLRPHTIPLTKQMLELLEVMKPISGHREYVFPSHRSPTKHANSQTANMALKRMGFAGELVSHGLRALASTTLNEQGFDPDVIEAALAHVDRNEVRRAYNRAEYLERRRKLMDWWSNHIEQSSYGNLSVTGMKNLQVVQ
ncbi:integrase domain-containing protein [Vibrio sp. PID23_8]|uniref:integrase domain-containing protein n=1 Tax=Vibrio sp. PID23_8 TaxID=1583767 RepID=UPI000E697AC8|nr:integrase domain-containing protein [Vibrio sp. PID23_8]RIZ54593.1 integrase [Vibrio sp. PID23_8]